MAAQSRRLPVGIQSFEKIRQDGFLYVDKTDLVWYLVNKDKKYNYFCRPRRFGKSLLVDTLRCYLEGRKELFEGLKIMQLETEWKCYPVIRLDMSRGGATREELQLYLNDAFKSYEKKYGIPTDEKDSLANRLNAIIVAAHKQTGEKVSILIDEYDAPLQHSWGTPQHEECAALYRSVFAILKADDEHEKFVFITGITKFTQISLFSALNNLSNISFDARYTTLCGITEQEIEDNFLPEMQQMAEENGWSVEEAHRKLKAYYDGYHFCHRNMVDIYNPYSLVNALSDRELRNYWASSGATSLLPKFVPDMEMRLGYFDKCYVDFDTLGTSDVLEGGDELFLYQSGYLTIKGYEDWTYELGFPNTEVKQALYKVVLPALVMRSNGEVISTQNQMRAYMNRGLLPEAMKCLKALIADVPYSNKKMQSMDMEERYRLIVSTIFNAVGYRVEVEHMHAGGRIDIVAYTTRFVYVIELKLKKNGGLASAQSQIVANGYAEPFKADHRTPICLAIELDDMGKGMLDWCEVKA